MLGSSPGSTRSGAAHLRFRPLRQSLAVLMDLTGPADATGAGSPIAGVPPPFDPGPELVAPVERDAGVCSRVRFEVGRHRPCAASRRCRVVDRSRTSRTTTTWALTASLLTLVLTDTRFIVYYNSFFTEPASLVALLFLIAILLHLCRRPGLAWFRSSGRYPISFHQPPAASRQPPASLV